MRIKLHDDIEGHKSGETVDVPEERAKFYLANGYASAASYNADEHPEMGVPAKIDPRLAENRKDEPNVDLRTQLADGLGKNADNDPDAVTPVPRSTGTPIELTNGKGDPAKAEKGKAGLEKAADSTDPDDAPEADPALVADRAAAADKVEAKVAKVEDAKDGTDTTAEAAAAAKKTANRQRA